MDKKAINELKQIIRTLEQHEATLMHLYREWYDEITLRKSIDSFKKGRADLVKSIDHFRNYLIEFELESDAKESKHDGNNTIPE